MGREFRLIKLVAEEESNAEGEAKSTYSLRHRGFAA